MSHIKQTDGLHDTTPSAEAIKQRFSKFTNANLDNKKSAAAAPDPSYNPAMETVSRPELDAKLEAMEARADARLSRFEERINLAINAMTSEGREFKEEIKTLRQDIDARHSNMRSTLIITAVTVVLTIVLGIGAFNATLLSNMVASFESGKSTATALTTTTEQLKQTQEQLKEIQISLDRQAAERRSPK